MILGADFFYLADPKQLTVANKDSVMENNFQNDQFLVSAEMWTHSFLEAQSSTREHRKYMAILIVCNDAEIS